MPTPTPTPINWPTAQPSPQIQIFDKNYQQITSDGAPWNWVIGLQMDLISQTSDSALINAQWLYTGTSLLESQTAKSARVCTFGVS
jgi:hypothetical protein